MSLKEQLKNLPSIFLQLLKNIRKQNFQNLFIAGLILCLIFFGEQFSKQKLFWILYLHDAILFVGSLLMLYRFKIIKLFWPIYLVLSISVVYLVYSIVTSQVEPSITIRQFALFGYLGCFTVLICSQSEQDTRRIGFNVDFLISIAIVGSLLQVYSLVSAYLKFGTIHREQHLYFSKAAIVCLVLAAAAALVYLRKWYVKMVGFLIVLILSVSTGHASMFFAVAATGFAFLLVNVSPAWKASLIIAGISILLFLIPRVDQLNDINARWRVLFWKDVLGRAVENNYGLLGKGFGVPYADKETEMYLYKETTATGFVDIGDPKYERYLGPMHNSFVTAMFAIGILPGLFLLVPFLKLISIIARSVRDNCNLLFLTLSLVGASVWVSFNVILELPHSAILYWYIYFSFWIAGAELSPSQLNKYQSS